MKLTIKNIGKIKEANIELNGLTVIAGENDTGKSTVGKLMFSIVKIANTYKSIYNDNIESALSDILMEIATKLLFSKPEKNKKINELDSHILELSKGIRFNIRDNEVKNIANDFMEYINSDNDSEFFKNNKEFLFRKKKELDIILQERNNKEELIITLQQFLNRIFNKNINNSVYTDAIGSFQLDDLISFEVKENIINLKNFNENIDKSIFSDSTFIDNPLILDVFEISGYKNLNKYFFTEPNFDLFSKIKKEKEEDNLFNTKENNIKEILSKIELILKGLLYFDKSGNLKYKVNKNSKELNISDIASGSKAFTLLKLLIQNDFICDKNHLLILDEPENHLHPEWQIKYAEILVFLIKNYGLNVIITSHSPYFIQGLAYYSRKIKLSPDKANFYLSEKDKQYENFSNIKKIKNLDEIFIKFSNPLEEIYGDSLED